MQEVAAFAEAAQQVIRTIGNALTGLNALARIQLPTEEELRAWEERARQSDAERRAYEAERLRRNPNLRYRSRRPLWYRLKYPVRGHQRPASLIHESPDWYDY